MWGLCRNWSFSKLVVLKIQRQNVSECDLCSLLVLVRVEQRKDSVFSFLPCSYSIRQMKNMPVSWCLQQTAKMFPLWWTWCLETQAVWCVSEHTHTPTQSCLCTWTSHPANKNKQVCMKCPQFQNVDMKTFFLYFFSVATLIWEIKRAPVFCYGFPVLCLLLYSVNLCKIGWEIQLITSLTHFWTCPPILSTPSLFSRDISHEGFNPQLSGKKGGGVRAGETRPT